VHRYTHLVLQSLSYHFVYTWFYMICTPSVPTFSTSPIFPNVPICGATDLKTRPDLWNRLIFWIVPIGGTDDWLGRPDLRNRRFWKRPIGGIGDSCSVPICGTDDVWSAPICGTSDFKAPRFVEPTSCWSVPIYGGDDFGSAMICGTDIF
jgi:hypothetical protein